MKPQYEQQLKELAERLVTPERYGLLQPVAELALAGVELSAEGQE